MKVFLKKIEQFHVRIMETGLLNQLMWEIYINYIKCVFILKVNSIKI